MKIRRPSRWAMYCPYCGKNLIMERGDFYMKSVPGREVEGWNFLQKLVFGRKKMFNVKCVKCVSCGKEIQLKEENDEWDNHPYWAIEHEIIDGVDK